MVVMPRQEGRAGVLETPLGPDKLAIVRFDGAEGINELFEWRLEALSADADIDFDQLIGKHATLTINSVNGRKRKFDGIVTETQWLGVRDHFHAYRLVLRPWLWILSNRTDNYIFHDMSVTDIIADVFSDYGALADFDDRTSGPYEPIEYCVQYRESDMAFVTRLMEEFGICFSFVHSDSAHKLVMSDANSQFDTAEGGSRRYIALSGQDRRTEECIHSLVPGRRFASGKATWKDYNFKKPTSEMLAEKEGTAAYEQAGKELYDWPGRYVELGQGQTFAQIKLEAQEAKDRRCMAAGNSPSLWAGCLMTLEGYPVGAYNIEYLVLRSQHTFVSQSYRSGGGAGEDSYEGQYELLDSAIPLRPLKLTPCPIVQGPQTAIVVGKDKEEIDCDEYGRILVRFHWDRESDQSMRCRVAQNWAYKQWGGMIIPRIGMEVMVEFLDGDPDRPLVTGCVYNGDNKPPYTLPKFKTRSTFKTNSHKAEGFNEIRFEDEAGEEEIYIHAQKYLNIVVGNNETHSTGLNRSISVAVSQSETIGQDKTSTVGRDQIEKIGNNLDQTIVGDRTVSVGKSDHLNVGTDQVTVIGASSDTTVGGTHRVHVGGSQSMEVATSSLLKAGLSVVIEAVSISLKSGGSFVNINPAGVQIQGPMVLINSGGAPGVGVAVPKKPLRSVKQAPGPFAVKYQRSAES